MRTTGIYTEHQVKIKVDKVGVPIYLIPIGDIHYGSHLHDAHHFDKFLSWGSKKPRCYFLGMGDYLEISSSSEREVLSNPKLHETTLTRLDKFYSDMTIELYNKMKFMKGRMIGCLEGNHYSRFQDGSTTTNLLCKLLDTKYLGVCSFIRLSFDYSGKRASVDIFAHHGKGNGLLAGTKLNNVEHLGKIARANIYLMGDNHSRVQGKSEKLALKDGNAGLRARKVTELYARTGSFTKGYIDGDASYIADKALPLTGVGVIKIELTPQRTRIEKGSKIIEDEFYIDIHASL